MLLIRVVTDQCGYDGLGMWPDCQKSGSWVPSEHGKRAQGGQRKTLDKVVLADAKRFTDKFNVTLSELQLLATDRIGYRQMITSKRYNTWPWCLGPGYSIDWAEETYIPKYT